MNILFIAPYVPSRIRVRPFHIIKELARRHSVHIVALGETGDGDIPGIDELRGIVSEFRIIPHSKFRGLFQSLLALPTMSPMCTAFCRSTQMQSAIDEVTGGDKFDIIHVEHLRAAHFAPNGQRPPVIIDAVDCLTDLFGQMAKTGKGFVNRMIMAEEAWKLKRHEPKTLGKFDQVVVTSDSERAQLLKLDKNLKVDVVENGVDTDYFAPQGSAKNPSRLVFSGKMGYAPNAKAVIWFAQNVYPALKNKYPALEFVVVGSDPPADVQKLSQEPGITVTGYVDDIRPHLDSSSIAVVPMQVAVGIQNKVLEAMAMGLPVVASPVSAKTFGGDCPGIIEADSPEEMAAAVSKLLENPGEAEDMGRQGREETLRRYSWQSSVGKLEDIYTELIQSHQWNANSQ